VDETKPATQVFPETRAIVTSDGDVLWVIPNDDTDSGLRSLICGVYLMDAG